MDDESSEDGDFPMKFAMKKAKKTDWPLPVFKWGNVHMNCVNVPNPN